MSTPTYAHMGLNCRNIEATEDFYCRNFGFKRARAIPLEDDRIVFLKAGNVYLELFSAKGEPPEAPYTNDGPSYAGFRHIAFTVDDVDDTLKTMGKAADITLGPLAFDGFIPGWKSVWIRDPDGRIIEISQGYRDEH